VGTKYQHVVDILVGVKTNVVAPMKKVANAMRTTNKVMKESRGILLMNFTAWKQLNQMKGMSRIQMQKLVGSGRIANETLSALNMQYSKSGKSLLNMKKETQGVGAVQKAVGNQFATTGAKMSNGLRMVSHGMRGFRMELLSVMFFGIALSRVMTGLLQPTFQLAGIFDIFNETLGIGLLPIGLYLLESVLIPFMDWFLNLSEPVRFVIGAIILFIGTMALILMVVGQVLLGIGGLIIFMPVIAGAFALVSGAVGGAFAAFLAGHVIIAALVAFVGAFLLPIILLLAIAFANNGEKIMAAIDNVFKVVGAIFGDIIGVIEGFIDLFMAIVSGDGEAAGAAFVKIFTNLFEVIKGIFWDLPFAIGMVFGEILRGIGIWVLKIPGFFIDLSKSIVRAFLELPTRIGNIFKGIGLAIKNAVPWLFDLLSAGGAALGGLGDLLGGVMPFASGGIVTRPTLGMVGEAGPEAIIPLNRLGGMGATNNTFNPVYEISANISSDIDIRDLAERLNRELKEDYLRTTFR